MIVFETDKKPLHFLLDQIDNRQLALPDFQRSFVWPSESVRELLVSVFSSYPAGTLLQLQVGSGLFRPREFETAPSLTSEPPYLVLDGQQRLTSLYQACRGHGSHRFFLNIGELVADHQAGREFDLDEAVEVFSYNKAAQWDDPEAQARDLMLPMSTIFKFTGWMFKAVGQHPGDDKLRDSLLAIDTMVIKAFEQYQFPVTSLGASTSTAAVCSIFETLNRTGIKLSVFELLTARAYAENHRLRDIWSRSYEEHPILAEFAVDPYDVLQVIALWRRGSAVRGQVLALSPGEIVEDWPEATANIAAALELLRDECGVLAPRWLPYGPSVVVMATAWRHVTTAKGPEIGLRRARLKKWFWVCSFSGRYDNSANTTAALDQRLVGTWLSGGETPAYVAHFTFDSRRWRDITTRQRALYRASMALVMRGMPLDFHTGKVLTQQIIESERVDDHHIYPRKYLETSGQPGNADSILNRTLIDRITNITISAKAPSVYLAEMSQAMGESLVAEVLASHHIPSDGRGAASDDDFEAFLSRREEILRGLLEAAAGSPGAGSE